LSIERFQALKRLARVDENIEVMHGDMFRCDISKADIPLLYLTPEGVSQLEPRLEKQIVYELSRSDRGQVERLLGNWKKGLNMGILTSLPRNVLVTVGERIDILSASLSIVRASESFNRLRKSSALALHEFVPVPLTLGNSLHLRFNPGGEPW
jgi:hypothetical protein